jgi:hypothetical protein
MAICRHALSLPGLLHGQILGVAGDLIRGYDMTSTGTQACGVRTKHTLVTGKGIEAMANQT